MSANAKDLQCQMHYREHFHILTDSYLATMTYPRKLVEVSPESRSSKMSRFFLRPSPLKVSRKLLRCGRLLACGLLRSTVLGAHGGGGTLSALEGTFGTLGGATFGVLGASLTSLTAARAEMSGFSRNEAKLFWKVVPVRKGDVAPCRP